MDKKYQVTLHFLYITEVKANNKVEALGKARDETHFVDLEETNNEVEELHETN